MKGGGHRQPLQLRALADRLLKVREEERAVIARVLVLSIHPEDQYAMRALEEGAAGYLMKDSAPTELIAAVRKVLRGERYVSPTLGELLATRLTRKGRHLLHETLSGRELEVLRLLASGKTMGQITDALAVSNNLAD